MRISDSMQYERFLLSLSTNLRAVQQEQERIGTGKRINRPSDDPVGAFKALDLSRRIARYEQFERNMNEAETFLTESESTVRGADAAMGRAYELAVQFANSTYGSTDRASGAKELEEIRNEIVALANRRVGDRYIYSGYRTDTPAYSRTLVITAGVNDQVVFDAGGGDTTVNLAAGIYGPEELGRELKGALENANGSTDTYNIGFDYSSNRFSVMNMTGNADIDIKWEDANTTAGAVFGFSATDHPAVTAGASAVSDSGAAYERGFSVTALNNSIVVNLDGVPETVTLTPNSYTAAGLAAEIQSRLNAADDDNLAPDSYAVTFDSSTQAFTIGADGLNSNDAVFDWQNGGSTAAALLGFTANATLAAGGSMTSDTRAGLSSYYKYQGDQGAIDVEVGSAVSSTLNIPGNQVFDAALASLDRFIASMNADSTAGIGRAIGDIQGAQQALLDAGATYGARMNRLDGARDRNTESELLTRETLSGVEDADIVETVVRMERRQAALESLRLTGFESFSRSLFDFLR